MSQCNKLLGLKKLGGRNTEKVGGPKNWVGQKTGWANKLGGPINWVGQCLAGLPVA